MFTPRELIYERLGAYQNKETLKPLFNMMMNPIIGDADFKYVYDELVFKDSSIATTINENLKADGTKGEDGRLIKVSFPVASLLDEASLKIYSELIDSMISDLDFEELRDLMSRALSNRVLFEGMCLSMNFPFGVSQDLSLHKLCIGAGAQESYEELVKDPVYQARKNYSEKLYKYIKACVNLYGVTTIYEIEEAILHFEKHIKREDLVRAGGPYEYSLIFTPRYFCRTIIYSFVFHVMLYHVDLTEDGLIINKCFSQDFEEEQDEFDNYMNKLAKDKGANRDQLSPEEEMTFFDTAGDNSYRRLVDHAAEKPPFIPSRKEDFLAFADDDYCEITDDDRKFMRYLKNKYGTDIRKWAEKQTDPDTGNKLTLDDAVEEILKREKKLTSDHKENWDEVDMMGSINQGINVLTEIGIQFDSLDALNALMPYLMAVMNGTRLWSNHGYSPMELSDLMRKQNPDYGKNLTLVPGSSQAARNMAESREELEKMGAHVDLDYGTGTMPYVEFPRGMNGPMVQKTKKIYPNDPCPCGSGKKYKYCHGRKK